jgi:hypothetical protein
LSAPAIERPPVVAGNTLVRTPGTGILHLVIAGAELPPHPVFHVPLECAPTGGLAAPAVRRYDGPADSARTCPACLTIVHGAPPAPPALEHLPFELPPPVYAERSLPAGHRGQAIEWQPWEPALRISHCDPSCDWCGDPGPGLLTIGRQPHQLRRYVAFRCSACEQMHAYEQVGPMDLQPVVVFDGQGPRRKR